MQSLDRPGGALVANAAATAAVTNLTAASWTQPANRFEAGQVWKLSGRYTYLHTAAATPTLTLEMVVGGAVVCSAVVTPISVAATFHGVVEAYFTVRTIGATGTIMPSVHLYAQGLTQANEWGGSQVDTATDTIDTTISRLVELRMRMTTAGASNTLTISQGWVEKLVG